ncbi:PREDICTED: F-box protein At3g07870-like [Nelumbo nucifera]|uniref:F-box protein At3g07870-like n=1 Tax=Nelumbo nucifera TaxID=4432 RepID=A0A1U8BD59_NELNU|nr:PREDICTED: F-box protein At3g07870-like [Nelumbo nucifera]
MQRRKPDSVVEMVDQGRKRRRKKNSKVDLENIPEEIISSILVNIPAHKLYELRSVCKQWFKLISEPNFIDQHLSRSEPGLLVQYHHWRYMTVFLEMKGERFRVRDLNLKLRFGSRIHASCNGLILLEGVNQAGGLFVANPVTKQCMKLPPRSGSYSLFYGFAHHPGTRVYKVLTLNRQGDSCICDILTLGSDSWRHVLVPQEFRRSNSLYLATKGFLHNITDSYNGEDKEYMHSMDMVHETFHRTRLPVSACGKQDRLFELGGFLAFTTRIETTSRFDIWVLKDFHKGNWVKQHSVVLEGVRFANKRSLSMVKPVGSLKNGKVIIFTDYVSFYATDVELKWVRRIWKLRADDVLPHVNSLISCNAF